jgi:pyridoxamine 5'-phosphate oxidase
VRILALSIARVAGYPRSVDPWLDALDPDPLAEFSRWLEDAREAGVPIAEAMTLATATADAVPSARMVLLKGHDDRGFRFFTNRESRKANELKENARAALVVYWQQLNRQVRIEGDVEEIDEPETSEYFASRPRGSRIGAWASPQSRPVADRDELEGRYDAHDARFPGEDVPLPPFWGGFRVVPTAIEFWQGRDNRFHDRARYERTGHAWSRQRLGP